MTTPGKIIPPIPMASATPAAGVSCCAEIDREKENDYARPGYQLSPFVRGFQESVVGPLPQVASELTIRDWLGAFRVRLGIDRNNYRVAPGLYCLGAPGLESPVLVSANYKLSFDALRSALPKDDFWLLVLDTRGVNVWCAAGKKTFSTTEIAKRVRESGLVQLVNHRRLILPQLSAPGVAGHLLKKECEFSPIWGPIRARDLPEFIKSNYQAPPAMREMTFSLGERLVLIPLEISLFLKTMLWAIPFLFLLSGITKNIFSPYAAYHRGMAALEALAMGLFAGAVLVPILLPWLPGRSFYVKGIITGLASGLFFLTRAGTWSILESVALILWLVAVSSYTAMNFTGATPFTSPSGVEKEMRRGMPLQFGGVFLALLAWLAAPFW